MSSKMSTKFRNQVTWNGYPMDVMKSGLQKYIRRGMTEKALYCAGELDLFKEAAEKEGEGIRTNLFNRILITYMEDVENLSIAKQVGDAVTALYQERTRPNRSKEKEETILSDVVVLLSHSTKARMCSHVRAVFNPTYFTSKELYEAYPSLQPYWNEIRKNLQESPKPSLEDASKKFALYLKQKSLLAIYYGFQVAASEEKLPQRILGSSKPVWFLFKQLLEYAPEMTNLMLGWSKNYIDGMKEDFMCWLLPLLHVVGAVPAGEPPVYDRSAYASTWDRNRGGETIEVDDFIEDRHTHKGRGKSLMEFALIGAHVENEAPFVNDLWKAFYEDGKRFEEGIAPKGEKSLSANVIEASLYPIPSTASVDALEEKQPVVPRSMKRIPKPSNTQPLLVTNQSAQNRAEDAKESTAYNFVVRAQLTTTNTKQDVYFAKEPSTQKLVVVKGPFRDRTGIDILVSNNEWKQKHGLPLLPVVVRSLIPDRWPEGVPLGARNKIDRTQPAYFLVFDSMIDESDLKTKMHSSKLWPETEVVDWDRIPFHFDYQTRPLTNQEMKDYVHALLYRYLLGVSDLADRNFLMRNGRVISIDEDVEDHEVNLYQDMRKNKAEVVYKWLLEHWDQLDVDEWDVKKQNSAQLARLAEIKDPNRRLRLFQPLHQDRMLLPTAPLKQVEEQKASKPVASSLAVEGDLFKSGSSISKMSDNFVFIDNIYRSRMTLLDILDSRGYDVAKFRKFSPAEATVAAAAIQGLSFKVAKKDNPEYVCDVRYDTISRQKLDRYFNYIPDEDSEKTEVIVMMPNPVADAQHIAALKEYMKLKETPNEEGKMERRKLRVSFFSIYMLVVNPLHHVLVPKHEIVPESEHKELMERLHVIAKSKFPEIKFHVDPIARCIGAVPGDIVKITRPSASAGEAIIYRVCAP